MLADVCRLWGDRLTGPDAQGPDAHKLTGTAPAASPKQGDRRREEFAVHLSPRQSQTLDLLLAGDGEKQIAAKLKLSRHTVHDYVKGVYRCFGVNSRAELLARWVRKG
jgi:DNA-binding CsgD family transcriptional regulator